jgi:hypothetical protein
VLLRIAAKKLLRVSHMASRAEKEHSVLCDFFFFRTRV